MCIRDRNYIDKEDKRKGIVYREVFRNGLLKKMTITDSTNHSLLIKRYYDNGQLGYHRKLYNNGNYDIKVFYKNGQLFDERKYLDGRLFNASIYDRDGNELDIGSFKNGNGILKSYSFKTGDLNGKYEYVNGELIKSETF